MGHVNHGRQQGSAPQQGVHGEFAATGVLRCSVTLQSGHSIITSARRQPSYINPTPGQKGDEPMTFANPYLYVFGAAYLFLIGLVIYSA